MSKKNHKNPYPIILLIVFGIAFIGMLKFNDNDFKGVLGWIGRSEALNKLVGGQNTILEQGQKDLRSDREKYSWIWERASLEDQIISEIKDVFGSEWRIALAIAKAESGLDKNAIGDKHLRYWKGGEMFGDSVGVFQIRRFPNRPSKSELLNFKTNIAYAKKLYDEQGFSPWSVFKDKTYLLYYKES